LPCGSRVARTGALRSAQKSGGTIGGEGTFGESRTYENNIGFSDRSDVPIERESVSNGSCGTRKQKKRAQSSVIISSVFFPAHWEKVYAQWLENIRDWCISRQWWWGHRIPAWYRKSQTPNSKSQSGEEIYVGIGAAARSRELDAG